MAVAFIWIKEGVSHFIAIHMCRWTIPRHTLWLLINMSLYHVSYWVFYLCAIIKYWNDLCTIEIWKSSPIPSLKFLLLCIPLPSACRSILTEVATNQSKNYLFYLCAIIKVQNDLCTIEKTKLLVWGPKWIQIKKWSTTKFHNFLRSTIFI